ncbi:MAG TPA: response regulator [Steroidobacteraceae bacterium]|nr:response regulator [Steroidobacteraceae bacterium]
MQIHSQAKFRAHIPLEDDSEMASGLAPSNFRILIVNEDMRCADALKRTLNDLGYFTTCTAYSARRALAVAEDFAPAVALLDLELPDMTGYQLAGKLRAHLSLGVRRVPLLAIAELAKFGTTELTRAAGFMGWLAKPVEPVALNALLGKLQTGAWS